MVSKRQKLEAEIVKLRNEGNWKKLKDATANLTLKYGPSDGVALLLEAEIELRQYLDEYPPKQQNSLKARTNLEQVAVKLQDSVLIEVKDSTFNVIFESKILKCIVLYAQGKTKACFDIMSTVDIDNYRNTAPCGHLRLAAEACGLKGLCMERLKGDAAPVDDIVACYDQSTELSFSYMSAYVEQFNGSPHLGYIIEQALQRSPLLRLKHGNVEQGINSLRRILISKECASIHQNVAHDLAIVLLRGGCEANYFPPTATGSADSLLKSIKRIKGERLGNTSPTATFTISPVDKPYSPEDLPQEAFLLLLLAESILNTDPILDMSSEYDEAKKNLLQDSRSLYNLLAVTVTDSSLYEAYGDIVETSLKYSYDEFHVWYQYGLSLFSAGKLEKSAVVFAECYRIRPEDPMPSLLCAKVYITKLLDFSAGLLWGKNALHAASMMREDDLNMEDYLCSSHVCLGLAHSFLCQGDVSKEEITSHRQKAILHFSEAHTIDPYDIKPLLFLSVELALDRRISEAVAYVKQTLNLQPYDLNCLHLLSLLLSAQKQYNEASMVLNSAAKFYPDNINILLTESRIQLFVGKNEDALTTCNHMTNIFVTLQEASISKSVNPENMLERMTSDRMSITNYSVGNDMDRADAGSVINSTVMSRFERAYSETFAPRSNSLQFENFSIALTDLSSIQCCLWLLTAEVYLTLQRYDEAAQSIQEAAMIFPLSPEVLYAKGRLARCKCLDDEAILMYQICTSINPKHYKAILGWAETLMNRGDVKFAKKLLEDAVTIYPLSHEAWLSLGNLLLDMGDTREAADCMQAALSIEASSPVVSFNSVAREL